MTFTIEIYKTVIKKLYYSSVYYGRHKVSGSKWLTDLNSKVREVKLNDRLVFYLRHLLSKQKAPTLLLWTVPFLSSSSDIKESEYLGLRANDQKEEIKNYIREADELFESSKYEEVAAVLFPYKQSGDIEVLWRLSRAQYNQAQLSEVPEKEKRKLIDEAYATISEAMTLDDSHWAVHKWMSVLLDAHSAYDGIKARVTQLEHVKNHLLRAAKLNPKDATTLYMLGSWCYQIADMPWFQRKIAATIFAVPPTSSFEEALHFFSKAEDIQPRFYSQNLLMLGKTLLKLQRSEEAGHYLVLARDYPCSTEEDYLVQKQAAELLKNLKINQRHDGMNSWHS